MTDDYKDPLDDEQIEQPSDAEAPTVFTGGLADLEEAMQSEETPPDPLAEEDVPVEEKKMEEPDDDEITGVPEEAAVLDPVAEVENETEPETGSADEDVVGEPEAESLTEAEEMSVQEALDSLGIDAETGEPLEADKSGGMNKKTIIIIAVVAVVLLCCCCPIVIFGGSAVAAPDFLQDLFWELGLDLELYVPALEFFV